MKTVKLMMQNFPKKQLNTEFYSSYFNHPFLVISYDVESHVSKLPF